MDIASACQSIFKAFLWQSGKQMWSLRKVPYNFLIQRDEGASCPAAILLSSSQPRQAGHFTSPHSKIIYVKYTDPGLKQGSWWEKLQQPFDMYLNQCCCSWNESSPKLAPVLFSPPPTLLRLYSERYLHVLQQNELETNPSNPNLKNNPVWKKIIKKHKFHFKQKSNGSWRYHRQNYLYLKHH